MRSNILKTIRCAPHLITLPWEYPWSSARAHVLGDPHPVLKPCTLDSVIPPGTAWGAWLMEAEDELALSELRANTYTGWPTGTPEFIAQLEARLGRRSSRQPAGRKAKEEGNI